jgi:hypothetical protein
MPDAERHRICRRCGRWFEPTEGRLMAPEATGPLGALRAARASFDDSLRRFQCNRCTRIRRTTQLVIWGTFLVLVAVILLLERLGQIK